ncbi:hypothetical protein JCM3775_003347 [Rhodotorula graminis]
MPPKQQLSKGTLGLKFMNRVVPSSPASTPPPPPPAQQPPAATAQRTKPAPTAPSSTSTAPATATKTAASRTKAAAPDSAPAPPARAHAANDDDWSRRTVGGTRTVVHESSLLSFPLLSTLSSRASTSTSTSTFTSTNATYSSMPLTAGAISGRRSYGGANIEIEKLNDPSSHQAAPASSSTAESKSALKKRQKAERDAETVPVRRSTHGGSTLSSAKTGKRTAALEAERRGVPAGAEGGGGGDGTKRRRTGDLDVPQWDGGEDEVALGGGSAAGACGFARPVGFEGARTKGKGKGRAAGDAMLRDDGDGHRWGKRGEVREWDEDKAGGSGESDVDVEGMSDLGGMSGGDDEGDSDEDSVVEEVAPTVKKGKAQKKQEVQRAFERSEEGRSSKAGGPRRRR